MRKNFQTEQGFSLLELLASLVIFAIVITAFMGFFYQSSMFTKKNEDDLVAMNLAREVLEVIKEENDLKKLTAQTYPRDQYVAACDNTFDPITIDSDGSKDGKKKLGLETDGTFISNNDLYPCFYFQHEPNLDNTIHHTYRVTVNIYKRDQTGTDHKLLTKTYGYVREAQ